MGEEELSMKAKEALRHIRNSVMLCGKVPSTRELMNTMGYRSPRSTMLLMEELSVNGYLERKADGGFKLVKDLEVGIISRTTLVPLVGAVACGAPMFAEENVEALIPVSTALVRQDFKYFILRAKGDSMNDAGINHGDMLLIRQQSTANQGESIVALIDDEATVKEYRYTSEIVTLLPRSSNPEHRPIILTHDFQIQGVVAAIIPQY